MSKVEILIDGKRELHGELREMNVSYRHLSRSGLPHGASVRLDLVFPKEEAPKVADPHDDVRGWCGPFGSGLINLQQPAVCACCGKVIEPVDLKIGDREERNALRRKGLVARWILPGGEVGAASRYAHPKCLAAIRDRTSALRITAGQSDACVQGRLLEFPEGLVFSGMGLVDSPEKKAQEERIKEATCFATREDAWRNDVQRTQERESRKVKALLDKQTCSRLKPERGDKVVAYGVHWTIESLEASFTWLGDPQGRHLRLPTDELVFVSRPGLLVVDPSSAKYNHTK